MVHGFRSERVTLWSIGPVTPPIETTSLINIGLSPWHGGGLAYLRRLVEDAKASGLVARAIEKTDTRGVSVAPPAK